MSNMDQSDDEFYSRKRGQTKYLSVRGDCLVENVEEGTEGAKSRVNKNGKTVWEIEHEGGLLGNLRGVYVVESKGDYGAQFCLRFKTKTIQVPLSSSHFKKFVRVCNNIDLNEKVLVIPYKMQKRDNSGKPIKDKFIQGWNIYQGGDAKENKLEDTIDSSKDGDVPALTKKKVKGKEVWDDSEQLEFYVDKLNEWLEANESYFAQFKVDRPVADDDDDSSEEETEEDDDNVPY